jgi:hypothetical protein
MWWAFCFSTHGIISNLDNFMDKNIKVSYKDWDSKKKNKVAIICLIIFACWAWFMYGGQKNSPSNSQINTQQISDRFDEIKSASPELGSIEHKSDTYVVFKYNTVPEDLEYVIRANTATFSKFNLENLGSGTTGYITIDAEYNGKVIFSCSGSYGKVESCRK